MGCCKCGGCGNKGYGSVGRGSRPALRPTQRVISTPPPSTASLAEENRMSLAQPFNPNNMNEDERRIQQLRREAIRRSLNK